MHAHLAKPPARHDDDGTMHAHLAKLPARHDDGTITLPLKVTTPDGATHPADVHLSRVQAEQLAARIEYLLPQV